MRIAIERPKHEAPPWHYHGAAHLPEVTFPLRATVAEGGEVEVELSPAAGGDVPPSDLADKARLIVRTAYRQAKADGEPPPWRIVRWRGEK